MYICSVHSRLHPCAIGVDILCMVHKKCSMPCMCIVFRRSISEFILDSMSGHVLLFKAPIVLTATEEMKTTQLRENAGNATGDTIVSSDPADGTQ